MLKVVKVPEYTCENLVVLLVPYGSITFRFSYVKSRCNLKNLSEDKARIAAKIKVKG